MLLPATMEMRDTIIKVCVIHDVTSIRLQGVHVHTVSSRVKVHVLTIDE